MNNVTLELPYPPSINHYWRHTRTAQSFYIYISKPGMIYREEVLAKAIQHKIQNNKPLNELYFLTERLQVEITVFPPDKRKRDLDNIIKAMLDSLQHAKIFENDNQIDKLIVTRNHVVKGGSVFVFIKPYV